MWEDSYTPTSMFHQTSILSDIFLLRVEYQVLQEEEVNKKTELSRAKHQTEVRHSPCPPPQSPRP